MISDTAVIMQMFHENICRNLNKTKATAFFFVFFVSVLFRPEIRVDQHLMLLYLIQCVT